MTLSLHTPPSSHQALWCAVHACKMGSANCSKMDTSRQHKKELWILRKEHHSSSTWRVDRAGHQCMASVPGIQA